jgi:hypothetical protein
MNVVLWIPSTIQAPAAQTSGLLKDFQAFLVPSTSQANRVVVKDEESHTLLCRQVVFMI